MTAKPWWSAGVRFECQGSGKCCVSRGEHGFVYLTPKDRRSLGKFFETTTREFTEKYCQKDEGGWSLRDDQKGCVFLKGKQCSIYEARPTQCRTWPFWPENMNAKAWKRDVASFCPGIGKGDVWSGMEIRKQLRLQEKAEENP